MASSLEQHMEEIGKEHGFHAVSVGFNTQVSIGRWWSANVHWEGFSRSGTSCASGHGDNPYEALKLAVKEAAERRVPFSEDSDDKADRIADLRAQLAALTGEAA